MRRATPGEGGSLRGLARWRADQRYALGEAKQTLGKQPLATGLIMITLALALLLPAALGRVLGLLEANIGTWPTTPKINVFFAAEVPPGPLLQRWRAHPDIADLRVQTAQASAEEFQAALGVGSALGKRFGAAPFPPLPSVVVVTPREDAQAPARVKALAEALEQEAGTLGVQVDLAWVLRLRGALEVFSMLLYTFQGLLTTAALLLVGTVTRMALLERLPALRTLRLLGATNGFLLAPFIYQALAYGLGGGFMAGLGLLVLEGALSPALTALASAYALPLTLSASAASSFLFLLASGLALAFLGALLAGLWVLRRFESGLEQTA
ncbi:MAG: hypothetical protein RLZZ174_891 [Pseudomonadota bacterium]